MVQANSTREAEELGLRHLLIKRAMCGVGQLSAEPTAAAYAWSLNITLKNYSGFNHIAPASSTNPVSCLSFKKAHNIGSCSYKQRKGAAFPGMWFVSQRREDMLPTDFLAAAHYRYKAWV